MNTPRTDRMRAVWTDFGGVLTPPVGESMAVFGARVGVPVKTLQAAIVTVTASYGVQDPMAPLDTPLVTEDEWARHVEKVLAADFGLSVDLGDVGETWFAGRPVNQDWIDCLRRLSADGVFVGMLSNMVPTWDRHWRAMVPPEGLFDAVVTSYEAGCRKPDKEIFDHAAAVAGFAPEECVLVDDMARNCAGAEAAGWRAVEFSDTAQALRTVSAWVEPTLRTPSSDPKKKAGKP